LPKYEWLCGAAETTSSSSEEIAETPLTTPPSKYNQQCKPHHNPCKNNAICKQIKIQASKPSSGTNTTSTKLRVQCHCPLGFRGKLCEEDIDECVSVGENDQPPCSQGATCINTHGSYICNCTLEPPTLCYNTLSSKFSASVLDLKQIQKGGFNGAKIENSENGFVCVYTKSLKNI
jgi:hypothetical protein